MLQVQSSGIVVLHIKAQQTHLVPLHLFQANATPLLMYETKDSKKVPPANRLFRHPSEQSREKSQHHNVHTSRSEEHTSELQSRGHLVCRLLLEKKKKIKQKKARHRSMLIQ